MEVVKDACIVDDVIKFNSIYYVLMKVRKAAEVEIGYGWIHIVAWMDG